MKLAVSIFLVFGLSGIAVAAPESNYSGQEQRKIKSLSQAEIDGYLAGKGMGFAKPAELNHFPGPKHVIEFSNELALSKEQREQTQRIYDVMKNKATEYGQLFVENEEKIEKLFSEGIVNPHLLEKALSESAKIRSKLRGAHLVAHIEQKAVLSKHQVRLYDNLRGYTAGQSMQKHKHHH